MSTLAVFPTRLMPNPFGPGDVPVQAVPTTVVEAHLTEVCWWPSCPLPIFCGRRPRLPRACQRWRTSRGGRGIYQHHRHRRGQYGSGIRAGARRRRLAWARQSRAARPCEPGRHDDGAGHRQLDQAWGDRDWTGRRALHHQHEHVGRGPARSFGWYRSAQRAGTISSRPPMNGRSASGITTEPSACW